MVLNKLSLTNFRNYASVQLHLSSKLNLVYGCNAQGKTNFLESIYVLCLGRSFRSTRSQEIVKSGEESFLIEGEFVLDNGIAKTVVVNYIRDRRKEISVDHKKVRGHSEIFGTFPVVLMAPDEFRITSGGPAERRRFLDILLSQVSMSYLINLQEYSRTLKQRNRLLQSITHGKHVLESVIDPWTEKLVKSGSMLIQKRIAFIQEFSQILMDIYRNFSETEDRLEIALQSQVEHTNGDDLEAQFLAQLRSVKEKEKVLGTTLAGPHRDEVQFSINGMDLRKFGSRGEHKSVLISLKMAEFQYIRQRRNETPVLLLDDCYSELDEFREEQVFRMLPDLGQIVLTTPKGDSGIAERSLQNIFPGYSRFHVERGQIACQN